MTEENKIRDAADAIKGVVEAVPVYQDVLQPAAREFGIALQTLAKTIHIVLAPISVLVWGYAEIKDFVSTAVAAKLKHVPPENIVTPKPNVAGPLLESLKYTGHDQTLRDMYANLLATAMDSRTASGAHPAFVEIIRQLTSDEARIIRLFTQSRPLPIVTVRLQFKVETETERGGKDVLVNFSLLGYEAGCEFPRLTSLYLDNLCRLGLAEIPSLFEYASPGVYDALEKHAEVLSAKESIESNHKLKAMVERHMLNVTALGKQFCEACVVSHDQKDLPKGNVS